MWAISCILLIIGTVAGICGTSFYLRNREAAGSIRSYIFSYGLSAAVWCIFFGCIGFCEDFAVCARLRSIGDIGIDAFLITETFLITNISGARKRLQNIFRLLAVIMGIIDFIIFAALTTKNLTAFCDHTLSGWPMSGKQALMKHMLN